jgi:putative MATE family efflux protein
VDIKKQLLTKEPKDLMLQLSIPAVLGMLVIGLYPLMDGIFAGQIIGQKAMSAISISMPLTFLNTATATLVGVGSASILSRALGEGNQKITSKIMGNLTAWIIFISLSITVLGIIFAKQFLMIAGATDEISALAFRYLRIVFIGSVFVNFTQSSNMVIRGQGLMKEAMKIMVLGALLNIILDPIFMIALKDKGIEGAAIATVLAQMVQALMTLNYFKKKSVNVKINKIKFEKEIYVEMFMVGVSAMLMQLLFMIQQTLLYRVAFEYGGEDGGILMAASMRLYSFSFIPLWGMSQGLQPVIGTNFGAKKYNRVKRTMNVFMFGGIILAAVFWIPAQLFPQSLLKIFNVSDSIINNGVNNFRMFYSVYILYGIMVMNVTFFQSIGHGKKAGKIVLLRQLIFFVPCILLFPKYFGVIAVWYTQPLVDFIMIVVGYIMQKNTLRNMLKLKAA